MMSCAIVAATVRADTLCPSCTRPAVCASCMVDAWLGLLAKDPQHDDVSSLVIGKWRIRLWGSRKWISRTVVAAHGGSTF